MTASLRSTLRLSLPALVILVATSIYAQESMMLRNNGAPSAAVAINRGDFNGDGILDLVTANVSQTNSISVFPGRADGTFAPPITTATGHQANDLAFGDFNDDGKLDVAVSNVDSNTVQILLGNGDGTFTLGDTILVDQVPNSITSSDFNNDGKLDLAVGIGITSNQGVTTNEVEILQGDGAGHFTRVNTIMAGDPSFVRKVRVGDFNNDGKVDIAVQQDNAVAVLFGHGDFNFNQMVINHYTQTRDLTTGDENQDRNTDILVSFSDSLSSASGGVDCYFGTNDQAFNLSHLIASSNSFNTPVGMIAADVNGDGINDIAAVDDDSTSASGVYVWLGNADGSFQQTPTKFVFTTDGIGPGLVAGDFNRDGKIDFAVGNAGNGTLEVLLNATPRAACQKNTSNQSMTVCQPQEATFSNSPLHIVAEGNDVNHPVTDINVYVDNVLQGQFPGSSIDQFFSLTNGDHFVVVQGFDSVGAFFRSDRHVTIYTGAPGETCPTSSSALSVNICLPAQNATLSSPVQIFANSYSPRPISAIQVYIDNQLAFNDPTATEVNKLFDMGSGSHFIVVKAWDADGNNVIDSRTIDVQ